MHDTKYRKIFITGGTGYIGAPLVHALVARGHQVRALVREASRIHAMQILPTACEIVSGNALDAASFSAAVAGCDTFVQMVGVPHPSPRKAREFRDIDLASALAGLEAAAGQGVKHLVYLSVSQFADGKAPAMRAYVASRAEAEVQIAARVATGTLAATFLRPWYVLGPGHRWPIFLKPLYRLASLFPALRANVENMGLVTRKEMVAALVRVVENPATAISVLGVTQIREIGRATKLK
ncbi:MAG: NAD(P)H-binding protein [Betaproteobacteria bacterium]